MLFWVFRSIHCLLIETEDIMQKVAQGNVLIQ